MAAMVAWEWLLSHPTVNASPFRMGLPVLKARAQHVRCARVDLVYDTQSKVRVTAFNQPA